MICRLVSRHQDHINNHFAVCFYPEALRLVVETAKPGVSVLSLCEKGDAYIMAETGKVFKKEKEMKKGEAKDDASVLFG